jgi:septal ring factor EnvC (AmiA/AmiB activator)
MNSEQVRIETENRNNFNGASVTLKNEQLRLEASRKEMKALYDETESLNATIQTHYKKLIADTDYLQTLDAMRPGFLKSLGELASHIQAVKTVVDQKIVKDEYKDEMITLLTGIHLNTNNISGYVATAFINHYNKYKNLLKTEDTDYAEEVKKLSKLAAEYKSQAQKTEEIEKERARIEEVLTKFKNSLTLSVSQREEFDLLVKDITAIFNRRASERC